MRPSGARFSCNCLAPSVTQDPHVTVVGFPACEQAVTLAMTILNILQAGQVKLM